MSDQRVSPCTDWDKVREDELEAIVQRRHAANVPECDDPRKSLVGIAFSGGGVRSGAFSLGVIQALYAGRFFRFIDYLSTVSGGGYAGAYLSSAALQESEKVEGMDRTRPKAPEKTASGYSPFNLPICESSGGKQSPRMLRFIFGGSYLRKSSLFLNRYLIGLLLIWIFVFSGLVAATSLMAWLFRNLDHIESRVLLEPLGFHGDVRLAFFPAFVFLVLWGIAWAVSYFRDRDAATGAIAHGLFYLLVSSCAIAVAALLGTGDIAVSDFMGLEQVEIPSSVKLAIYSSIVVSLIPYLNPKRLLQSGTSPKNVAEKYVYFVATRGLLFGVPFAMFSWFAREDISRWNEDRDSRLTCMEIMDWNPESPFWNAESPIWRLLSNDQTGPAESDSTNEGAKSLTQEQTLAPSTVTEADMSKASAEMPWTEFAEQQWLLRESEAALFNYNEYRRLIVEAPSAYDPKKSGFTVSYLDKDIPTNQAVVLWIRAWYSLAELSVELLAGTSDQVASNPISLHYKKRMEEWNKKKEITDLLNGAMKNKRLYQVLLNCSNLPSDTDVDFLSQTYWPQVQKWHSASGAEADKSTEKDTVPGKKWALNLVFLGTQAQALAAAITKENETRITVEETEEIQTLRDKDHERKVLEMNRQLLKAFFGRLICDKSVVYSGVVLLKDQETRLQWFCWSLLVFAVSGITINLNATSWHGFYSRRLGEAWIEPLPGVGTRVPFTQLETTKVGAPYHLVSGCVQLFGRRESHVGGPRDHFLLSQRYFGSESLGYKKTSQYMDGKYTLEDGVAVSGGAITPVQSNNPLILALFFLFNVRLGQWMESPKLLPAKDILQKLGRHAWNPFRVFRQLLRNAERRSICFVSDGGHFENLGIYPLLQRRCRLIIAFDAGQDANYDFADFDQLKTMVRMKAGISLRSCDDNHAELSLGDLMPSSDNSFSRSHYLISRILYPEASLDTPSWLVYVKASLTGDEPSEVLSLRKGSEFPHDATADQFYDPRRFDGYRRLGQHITDVVLSRLPSDFDPLNAMTDCTSFINAMVSGVSVADSNATPAVKPVESNIEQYKKILSDPGKDAFERGYAAVELADQSNVTEELIQSLVDALKSADIHLATVVGRRLETIGTQALPQLLDGLSSDSQPLLLHVIEIIHRIIQKQNITDLKAVEAVSLRLKNLSKAHRHELTRLALLNCLRQMALTGSPEFDYSRMLAIFRDIAAEDKSRSVQRLAQRTVAELHDSGRVELES